MKKPKYITVFIDLIEELEMITEEQTGRLLMAMLHYARDGETPDLSSDVTLKVMFNGLKKQIDRDFAKYEELCERRTSSAKKAAAARWHADEVCETHADASVSCQYNYNNKDKDNDEDYDKYNDNDNDYDKNEYNALSADESQARSTRSEKSVPIISEIFDYLNKCSGLDFKITTTSGAMVMRLLVMGYSAEDIKLVIRRRCNKLISRDLRHIIDPFVMFGESFPGLLEEAREDENQNDASCTEKTDISYTNY